MDFVELVKKVNAFDEENADEILKIVDSIDIDGNNLDEWTDNIFSDKVDSFDMGKLPFLIDELYKSNDRMKFMLCCMLLEATYDKLEFITALEDYPLFVAKLETLANTLVTIYEHIDNNIANCMSLIIINYDPEFEYFDNTLKERLAQATKCKLENIYNYLKTTDINPDVFNDLEVIIDMACYLKDKKISKIIDDIDNLGPNGDADLFIIKYKIINNLNILDEKIEKLTNENDKLIRIYNIMENLGVNNKYLKDVSQEKIATSDMVVWLSYPTELGSIPDNIELLGEFIYNNTKCYAFKFSKDDFSIKGDLLGISGGYPMNQITSTPSGYTFSKFEALSDNWEEQAIELVKFIEECSKNQMNNE